jgi:hypothetical protein
VRYAAFLAALALCACATTSTPKSSGPSQALGQGWTALAVEVTPARLSETEGVGARYGALIFRGGVELKSANPLFGGWSGIEIDKEGRFLAVSDQGSFLSGAIATNEAGDLTGVRDTKIGLMRDEKGEPLDAKSDADAEDIALLADGRYAVSFEHHHRVWIYDLAGKGALARAEPGPAIPQDMEDNEGAEALVQARDGALIVGREFTKDRSTPTQVYKVPLAGEAVATGSAEVTKDYALVALRYLPDGDLVALERFFLPVIGNRAVLRRYAASGLADSAPRLAGPELAALRAPLAVDNFEGLAVVARADGGARLYILSDNNFNVVQRTLLYAFDLPGPKPKKTP